MTKKLPEEVKLSRKPIKTACTFCHSKHLQCDETRPCKNCVKRGVGDTCVDAERKRSKRSTPKKRKITSSDATDGLANRSIANDTLIHNNDGISSSHPSAPVTTKRGRKRKSDLLEVKDIPHKENIIPVSGHSLDASSNYTSPSQRTVLTPLPPAVSVTPSSTEALTPTNSQHSHHPHQHNNHHSHNHQQQTTHNLNNSSGEYDTNDKDLLASPGLEIKTGRSTFIPPAYIYNQSKSLNNNQQLQQQRRRHSNLHPNPSPSSVQSTSEILSTASDILSTTSQTSSSKQQFESSLANDEYTQLTDLLNTNPPSPTSNGFFDFDDDDDDDDDEDDEIDEFDNQRNKFVRHFIQINTEEDSMVSSYPNNSTPNSYIYNPKHSQMANTAREIPNDIQEDENYTPPLIMRHIIKHPDDIYLTLSVKAYQYPRAYHALISYLKSRFDRDQLIEIAKCMAKYRPSFISATKSLYENDLIFTERSFQRTLLEYEKLIQGSSSPTLIWRRTGEIVAMTNEFAIMTGYSKISLLSKRTFIVELMDDESTIRYFQSFSNMAFGDLNATLLTDCVLRKANDDDYLRCACVWTIKRDVFDIPMLIVGQFLPILN